VRERQLRFLLSH